MNNEILQSHIAHFRRPSYGIYISLLLLILSAIAALPFVKTTIAVRTPGITRPQGERTEVRPQMAGIIETILVREGDSVKQGQLIAQLKDQTTAFRSTATTYEAGQRRAMLQDLIYLTSTTTINPAQLQTAQYRQQAGRYLHQTADQNAGLGKLERELAINNQLIKDGVIAPKEAFDKEVEAQRAKAAFQAFQNEQLAQWQADLQRLRLELSQLGSQQEQIKTDKRAHYIYAPVSGVVQNINNRYAGGVLNAGETLCSISPQAQLVAECYASTRDVGLLKPGLPARFQVDAFDYNYFGVLTGKIISIDNDFTLMENKPVFRVRCAFDSTGLQLKNGFRGDLQKGLTFQARFVVAERTLWQLLFDKVDDWLNPTAPPPAAIAAKNN